MTQIYCVSEVIFNVLTDIDLTCISQYFCYLHVIFKYLVLNYKKTNVQGMVLILINRCKNMISVLTFVVSQKEFVIKGIRDLSLKLSFRDSHNHFGLL